MRWDGSVAVVTGASRGIGRAVVEAAAARGARVGMIARSAAELEQLRARIGGGAIAVADVADREAVEAAIAALTEQLGPPDILVANAGIGAYGRFAEADLAQLERMLAVNYFGTVYATRAVLGSMIERGRGHIVAVASIAGRIGAPLEAGYSASKFAVAGLMEALAIEVGGAGVGVSIVNPGPVRTGFFDARGVPYKRAFPRPVSPEAVARLVVRAVERNTVESFIPRWLRLATVIKGLAPPAYRLGTKRDYRDELG